MRRYLVGVDEAGRGPLAGPVAVGAVCLPASPEASRFLRGIRDSKQLSPKAREAWVARARLEVPRLGGSWSVSLVGATIIDRVGIVRAVALGIRRSLGRLKVDPRTADVFLDGLLSAPDIFVRQETIVRGDERVPVIALASIFAKVRRDRHMHLLARQYPSYALETHKGYGTAEHYRLLKKHGLCEIHRRSFLKEMTRAR